MWYHFEYTSGGNPYIAKTEEKKKEIINKYKFSGCAVEKTGERTFVVHDAEWYKKHQPLF